MTETVSIEKTYRHSVEKVFAAFETAEAIASWFSPSDAIHMDVLEFDFRENGVYLFRFHLPSGQKLELTGRFIRIEYLNHLSFTWNWIKPDIHAGIETIVKMDFIRVADTTKLILNHSRLTAELMRDRHGEGWRGTLSRLNYFLQP